MPSANAYIPQTQATFLTKVRQAQQIKLTSDGHLRRGFEPWAFRRAPKETWLGFFRGTKRFLTHALERR